MDFHSRDADSSNTEPSQVLLQLVSHSSYIPTPTTFSLSLYLPHNTSSFRFCAIGEGKFSCCFMLVCGILCSSSVLFCGHKPSETHTYTHVYSHRHPQRHTRKHRETIANVPQELIAHLSPLHFICSAQRKVASSFLVCCFPRRMM